MLNFYIEHKKISTSGPLVELADEKRILQRARDSGVD
jgi:hypothetical protein